MKKRFARYTRTRKIAWQAFKVLYKTGLFPNLRPGAIRQTLRDMKRGRRGNLAIVHFHSLLGAERPALVEIAKDGQQRCWNFGQMEQRIHQLTHGLARLGIGPGDRVGTFLHNSPASLELNAALGAVGGTNVQIGYRLKAAEVAYLLGDSGGKVLFFAHDLAPVVEELLAQNVLPREKCISVGNAPGFQSYEALLAASGPATEPMILARSGFGGMMTYTSGTTGRVKGATRDFRRMGLEPILNFAQEFPLRHDERHLVVCPLYHSAAMLFVILVLATGGCNELLAQFEPEAVLQAIERERITSTFMVPTMLARIVALPRETLRKYDLSSLRWIMSGAAPLPTETARRVEDIFGPILYNFYGATETGVVTVAKPGEHTSRPGTIGRIIGGNEIRILDNKGKDVTPGLVGELYVKNSMMIQGYHNNSEATDAAQRDGFFSVGDLAYQDRDGYYYLADRKSDMIISGGVNVYPWEIEQRLHEHPAVQDVAVLGVPDREWGESVAAFVVLKPGCQATAAELIDHVRETLADYKRPRRIEFVASLPRNPTGKLLKRELRAQLQ